MTRAWALNLDAEHELEAGSRYTPRAALRARLDALVAAVAKTLPPGDRVIGLDAIDHALEARAWCPTPRALAAITAAGLTPPDAPPLAVLRRAHERGLAFELAAGELHGSARITSIDALVEHLARGGARDWMLKRAFGVAGRGIRPVRSALSEADLAWARASLREHALYVESRVTIARELSVHGWVLGERSVVRTIRVVETHARAFVRSELARALSPQTERALVDAGERTGAALRAIGYRGPFGIDAYEYDTERGRALRTLSEINPRYCMGWSDAEGWDPPR